MIYTPAHQRAESIMNMSSDTFGVLLNSKMFSEKQLNLANEISTIFNENSKPNDIRNIQNNTKNVNAYLTALLGNDRYELNDLGYKMIALNIIFGAKDFYNSVSDLKEEKIAEIFATNINTVKCKQLFDAKLASLEKNKSRTK